MSRRPSTTKPGEKHETTRREGGRSVAAKGARDEPARAQVVQDVSGRMVNACEIYSVPVPWISAR